MRKIWIAVLKLACGFIFSFLVLETGTQLAWYFLRGGWVFTTHKPMFVPDDKLGFRLNTGWISKDFYVNSLGYAGPEFSRKKPAGALRMILLGESTTMGFNAGSDHTITANLQDVLKKNGFPNAEVINAGVQGWSSYHHLLRLDEYAALEPDIVLLGLPWNDFSVGGQLGEAWKPGTLMGKNIDDPRHLTWRRKLYLFVSNHSAISMWLKSFYAGMLPNIRKDYAAPYEYALKNEAVWNFYLENHKKMIHYFREKGVRVGVVFFPYIVPQGKLGEYDPYLRKLPKYMDNKNWYDIYLEAEDKTRRLIGDLAREENVPVFDAAVHFDDFPPEQRLKMFDSMIHCSRDGTEAFAKFLFQEMSAAKFINTR